MTTSNSSAGASAPTTATNSVKSNPAPTNTTDTGRIRFGAGCRLPRPDAAPALADTGRIRFGAGCRIPAVR
jgi:hypothetical protein